jgi:hypothetical protein
MDDNSQLSKYANGLNNLSTKTIKYNQLWDLMHTYTECQDYAGNLQQY